ncbi:hypothetical protein SLEP1_g36032 [Rubroshorea leprosula]|uniref:Reverse transcriptase Ty1/copia-type domain-containing protein n=1 Tax=Rubroshorea leprosula TaxID=152421 RepID=A0AAV5KQM8_9ROSI|nr:hypothetical protein SLEP1_g36032 [Rubroshorea leprosula]
MVSFERIVTHPATDMVAKEVIEQPNVNLESLKHVILNLFNAPAALFTALSTKPWYFDSGCCNHMSSITAHFSSMSPNNSFLDIYSVDGSLMNLCDLGLEVTFSAHGCRVQDPWTGQLLGIGCKDQFRMNLCIVCHVNLQSNQLYLFQVVILILLLLLISCILMFEFHLLHPPCGVPGTSDELYNASPHALTSFVEDDLHAGCKWVYKIKTRSDGSVEHYKACLVTKGFTQEYGIDYEETFAPVAHLTSVRSLFAIAAMRRWKLLQMDVKNAFLNGDLEEEVYMKPHLGLNHPPNKVCRLCRALYGLKQSPRAWYAKISATMSEFGFTSSPHDIGVEELKQSLNQKFEMKDLGVLSYFLGLEVASLDDGYLLSEVKYVSDLVSKAELNDGKSVSTPLEPNVKLTPMDDSSLSDLLCYRQLVVIFRIIRYVKGTLFHGLYFSVNSSPVLRAYFDADWVGDPSDHRSTTGYCLFLGNSLIPWWSKKQTISSCSSTEAEYRVLGDTTSELLSLRWLLKDMGIPQPCSTDLYCDNQNAMQIAHNDVFHERIKHIEVDCHFIRHHVAQGTVHLVFIGSVDQPVDLVT